MTEITREQLLAALRYEPETGHFFWLVKRHNSINPGNKAGCDLPTGYVGIGFARKVYQAHRLAWFYVYGVWPKGHTDHINGDKKDNRIANLRDVTPMQNAHNQWKPLKSNRLGLMGVSKHGRGYAAQITINRKMKYLGTFDTAEKAHQAYLQAKLSVI